MDHAGLFADSPVNRGRQLELDVVRGLAILFMLLVHVHEAFAAYPFAPTWGTRLIRFLGGPPAAPVFMFALGVGVVYSRRSTVKALALRGLRLFVLAYALNFVRDSLSLCAAYLLTGEAENLEDAVTYFFAIDILAFAGLACLFFAAAIKLRFRTVHYIAAALLCAAANLPLSRITFESPALYRVTDLIWGTSEYTWFPFLTWIPFPIAGYLFGQLLLRCRDKQRFYKDCLWISIPALLAFVIFARLQDIDIGWVDGFWERSYFQHTLMGNLILLNMVIAWISVFFFLTPQLPDFVRNSLCRWSRNITEMYVIHWLILGFTWVILQGPFELSWIVVYFLFLVPVTDWLACRYLLLKAKLIPPKTAGGAAA